MSNSHGLVRRNVKANKDSEAGVLPSAELVAEMGQFNETLVKTGVMLAGEGLQANSKGYAATAGDDWMRPALCEEALRLGRILAELAPREPEVHGLVALMEIQASRLRTRVASDGDPILLMNQDRARWD